MKMLKSNLAFMKPNNSDGRYDSAIDKQKRAFKYFVTGAPYREELPEEEGPAAAHAA